MQLRYTFRLFQLQIKCLYFRLFAFLSSPSFIYILGVKLHYDALLSVDIHMGRHQSRPRSVQRFFVDKIGLIIGRGCISEDPLVANLLVAWSDTSGVARASALSLSDDHLAVVILQLHLSIPVRDKQLFLSFSKDIDVVFRVLVSIVYLKNMRIVDC